MYSLIDGSYFINLWRSYFQRNLVQNEDISGNDPYVPIIQTPAMICLKETEILERNDLFRMISSNKHFRSLRFSVPCFYSTYLMSHLIFDLLDLLSNELFFVQTKIEFWFESQQEEFMKEFKSHLKKNIPQLQKTRTLPVYASFLEPPPFHIEYSMIFDQRFHVLFLKESEECFSIQRVYFSIDL